MCYCPTPTLHLNLALTGDGAFLLSPKKTYSVWFISILNYGDTENVLINHLLLVIPMSYLCHYTNLCPHKPHKHAHTHTTHHTTHTHTHTHTLLVMILHNFSLVGPQFFVSEDDPDSTVKKNDKASPQRKLPIIPHSMLPTSSSIPENFTTTAYVDMRTHTYTNT